MPSVLESAADAMAAGGLDLAPLGLAWARAAPTVAIVPAFGLRALPAPARAVVALALAASFYPALAPVAAGASGASGPWAVQALVEAARGLPVALAAAVPLWAATTAGGVADALQGMTYASGAPTVEEAATPLGVLLSILASAIFLATGGPARAALALATHPAGPHPLLAAADDLLGGIGLAVAVAGPLLAAAVVLEIAAALVARAASPAQIQALLAPLRALAVLAVAAVVFERIAGVLARAVAG